MSTFDAAIPVIWAHEVAPGDDPLRGWVDHPADPGRETNWGISSLMIAREHMTAEDLGLDPATPMPYIDATNGAVVVLQRGYLKAMPPENAKAIYKRLYWDPYNFDAINDQTSATKIADCGVNCGQARAVAMAQRSATACGWPCVDDGVMGPMTIKQINACDPAAFVKAMAAQMVTRYQTIAAAHPELRTFLHNWLRRAAWGT